MQFHSVLWYATLGLALAFGAGWPGQAASQSEPPLVAVGSVENRLLADAADKVLDRHPLLRAALIAGGVNDDRTLSHWQQRFEELCQPLDEKRVRGTPITPEALFVFLHTQIMTGEYRASVTTLPETLSSGNYNCLTATILLVSLGDRYHMPIEAISTSGHIYCRFVGEKPIDVETTQSDWAKATRARSGTRTSDEQLPPVRSIDSAQVIAKIYYNRGLEQLGRRQFEHAVALLHRSLQLDPRDADARENLLAAFNNWALFLAEAERYADAVERIRIGWELDADYPPFAANYLHIHQRWAAWHCARHEYASAIEVLERGSSQRPDAPLFSAGPRTVYAQWLQWHLKRGEYREAAEVLACANQRLDQDAIARLHAHVQLTVED